MPPKKRNCKNGSGTYVVGDPSPSGRGKCARNADIEDTWVEGDEESFWDLESDGKG